MGPVESNGDRIWPFACGGRQYRADGRFFHRKLDPLDLIEEVFITTEKPGEPSAEPLAKESDYESRKREVIATAIFRVIYVAEELKNDSLTDERKFKLMWNLGFRDLQYLETYREVK